MSAHILVVEDDARTRMSIEAVLEDAGYRVTSAADGETAILLLEQARGERSPYDVVVTDIRMGTVDGIEVLYAARSHELPAEVIVLTGFGTMDTSIAALRAGAYDYLIKPCEPTDLLAYVGGALHRRMTELHQANIIRTMTEAVSQLQNHLSSSDLSDMPPPQTPPETVVEHPDRYVHVGALCIDNFQHTVSLHDQTLHLTPIEYGLLRCLAHEQGRVMGYCEIARRTHGHVTDKVEAHALLKPHIHNLRRKINPDYFVNVRGIGYMLVEPDSSTSSRADP